MEFSYCFQWQLKKNLQTIELFLNNCGFLHARLSGHWLLFPMGSVMANLKCKNSNSGIPKIPQ